MKAIVDERISERDGRFHARCGCGKLVGFAAKAGALAMLGRGSCRHCKKDYRSVDGGEFSIYRRHDGRWCSVCSGCGKEQAYTRKSHAKQSSLGDRQCRPCAAAAKKFSANRPVGDRTRVFNKFRKAAARRGIPWDLTEEQMYERYNGRCSMTNWPISLRLGDSTASLDRINSRGEYTPGNVQWVHSMVNMSKRHYSQEDFVEMCRAVAARVVD